MELFPAMPLSVWRESKETFHRFAQIVGKIRLAASPRRNHWWNVPYHLTGRGLTTRPMGPVGGLFCIDFDLIDHRLTVDLADGRRAGFSLIGRSVASFHRELFDILRDFGINVAIRAVPFDLPDTTPFAEDFHHDSYDPAMITRYWQVLSQVAEVLELHAREFGGKTSPVHHFWHTFDIALTRFTGRVTSTLPDDPVAREAYSREVISFGFWFGDNAHGSPMFYSYTAPEPDGLDVMPLRPEQAYWEPSGSGHLALLSYDDARDTEDPVSTVLRFYNSAYHAGAQLVGLDEYAHACPGGVSHAGSSAGPITGAVAWDT